MILIMIGGAAGVMQQQSSLAICIITKSNGFCYGIFCRNTISLMEDLSVTQQRKKNIYTVYLPTKSSYSKQSTLSSPSKFKSGSVMAVRRTCKLNQLFLSALPILIARGHLSALGQLCSPRPPIHLRASPLRIYTVQPYWLVESSVLALMDRCPGTSPVTGNEPPVS